jgi:hypothetical protein
MLFSHSPTPRLLFIEQYISFGFRYGVKDSSRFEKLILHNSYFTLRLPTARKQQEKKGGIIVIFKNKLA